MKWDSSYRQALGGYAGTKVRLADWIASEVLPKAPPGYVLDVFSGMSSVAYRFKLLGRPVACVDSQLYPVTVAQAVIANNGVMLSKEAVDFLTTANPDSHDDFCEKSFKNKYLPRFVMRCIDKVRHNLQEANKKGWASRHSKAIALAALCRTTLSVKAFARFSTKTVTSAVSTEKAFMNRFRDIVGYINSLVFSNRHTNKVCWDDGPDFILATSRWKRKPVAIVYMDPPYATAKSNPMYWSHYWFTEGIISNWEPVRNGSMSVDEFRRLRDITTAQDIADVIIDCIDAAAHVPVLALSYAGNGKPTPNTIRDVMKDRGRRVSLVSREHKRMKTDAIEVLIVGTLPHAKKSRVPKRNLRMEAAMILRQRDDPADFVEKVMNGVKLFERGDEQALRAVAGKIGLKL